MVKRLLSLFTILCLTFISTADAAEKKKPKEKHTKEYFFAYDVIEALNLCSWGLEYAQELHKSDSNDIPTMTASMLRQNSKYNAAKNALKKHTKDKDEMISKMATNISLGIDMQILANDKLLKRLKMISNAKKDADKGLEYEVGEVLNMRKESWEMISITSTYIIYIVKGSEKNSEILGDGPYKITEDERMGLLQRIEKLFGNALNRYYKHREAVEKGREGDPDAQTYLIVAIENLQKNLSVPYEKK